MDRIAGKWLASVASRVSRPVAEEVVVARALVRELLGADVNVEGGGVV